MNYQDSLKAHSLRIAQKMKADLEGAFQGAWNARVQIGGNNFTPVVEHQLTKLWIQARSDCQEFRTVTKINGNLQPITAASPIALLNTLREHYLQTIKECELKLRQAQNQIELLPEPK